LKHFESQITFLYYRDLAQASKFYEDLFSFDLIVDQGWAKIYQITKNASLGLVDETKGYCNWHKEKTVMVTLVCKTADAVDEWFMKANEAGINCLSEPHDVEELGIRCFLLEDPEGYVIEIQYFYED
jgi:predicted enzyme related to lactoylglutathione lyase